jgi:putative FmdB family regulatory protein
MLASRITSQMPNYEYLCKNCGHRFEQIRKFSDKPLRKCPECGGVIEQVISAPAVQFKGSGWYVTDYAKKGAASAGSPSSSSEGDSATKEAKDSKDTKDAKDAKDTKDTKDTKKDEKPKSESSQKKHKKE